MSNIEALKNIPEVSFIDNATLESTRDEIFADYTNMYQKLTGETPVLSDADPIRLVLLAVSAKYYQGLQYVDRSGKQDLLKYSYGDFLDNIAAMKKLTRNPAAYASVKMKFSMTSARGEITPIPGGTRVTTESGLYFMTDEYVEIPTGETFIEVQATALTAGKESNELPVGTINKIVDPVAYIAEVENTTVSAGGSDRESDDDFTERIYLAPSSYSVAGPTESYEYHAKQFRADVSDVKAYSPSPSVVNVLFLFDGGVLPTEEELREMEVHLSEKTIRPTADRVVAVAPEEQEYNITLKYFINQRDSAQAMVIQAAVEKAIEEYKTWQRKLGRDINPSELNKRIMLAGAKRAEVTEPAYSKVDADSIAKLGTESVIYGGLEDD